MRGNERNVLILGLAVISLIVVGYFFVLLGPLLERLEARSLERSDKEAELAELQQRVAELEAVRRSSPEIERQLLEYSKRVPTQPEVETLTVQFEEIARAANVTPLAVDPGTPGPPPGGGDYSVQPISLTFEGTYEELQEFLLRTRNLVRLVTVTDLAYEPAPEGTTPAPEVERLLQVRVEAEAYFQPSVPPSDVPAGVAPVAPVAPDAPDAPELEEPAGPEEATDGGS